MGAASGGFSHSPGIRRPWGAKKIKDQANHSVLKSPFVQRVWISLEAKNIAYQYVEVDPYKKPASLLELNPRGLVPALRHGSFSCYESTVLMEYV